MNKITCLLCITLLVSLFAAAPLSPCHGEMPQEARDEEPARRSPLHRWIRELKETHPEDHERLERLRISDPTAFRVEARRVLHRQFLLRLEAERPSIYEAYQQLDPEDQEWLTHLVARSVAFYLRVVDPYERDLDSGPNEQEQFSDLIHRHRHTVDVAEREILHEELRARFSEQYDRRLLARRRQLVDAERKLAEIRENLERGRREKDAYIDARINLWLNPLTEHE